MQGYKTWIGIFITVLGALGYGDLITQTDANNLINLLTQVIGIVLTVYGNWKAHSQIKALGGYSK